MDRIPYIVDYKHPTSSDKTWYRIYSDGWIEQGGTWTGSMSIPVGEERGTTINLPKAMGNTFYYVNSACISNYCLPFRFIRSTGSCHFSFGAYTGATRTITEFTWEVKGLIDPTIMPPYFK